MTGERPQAAEDWWRGAVIYQIYPRSFADSNGDGVGDLRGVIGKLDYIASLGVDGVWLSPFFTSPMKDFGYDVADYCDVDPLFGDLNDFDALIARAHALGLKVIIDQVWSHTSDQHPWFRDSCASRTGPKADWYVWADAKPDGSPPNNWQATFGGPSWSWSPRRRQYYLHNFLESQPDLNFWTPQVQDAILEVARFWLDRGVDGFRLDVVNYYFQDRRLRDNPIAERTETPLTPTRFQRHVRDISQPENLEFIARLRALTDSYNARMLVGEIYDPDPLARQVEYTRPPHGLHTAYCFYLLEARTASPQLFRDALAAWRDSAGWPSWSLSNHDVERFPSRFGGDPQLARLALMILFCLRGAAFLYQGDELALPHAEVPFERLQDPYAINAWTGGSGRDGARTPMVWNANGNGAGFTEAAESWLPIDPRHRPLAADRQDQDPNSFLNFARTMIAMRKQSAALRLGAVETPVAPEGVLEIVRRWEGETVRCLFNLSPDSVSLACESEGEAALAETGALRQSDGQLTLGPYSGRVMRGSG